MEEYYQDGYDSGYGNQKKPGHGWPQTDSDDYSYRHGQEEGRRRKRIADELDRELYGDDR